jgi:hypothetical protein
VKRTYDKHGQLAQIYKVKQNIKIKSTNVSPKFESRKLIGFKQDFVEHNGDSFKLPTIDGWNQNDEIG